MSRAIGVSSDAYESKFELRVVMLCSMAGTLMQALNSTIANVALPYMQGSLAASRDQITWVLTSYIVTAAIMTAPVGWIASRFGRKNFAIVSLSGFHDRIDAVWRGAKSRSDDRLPPAPGRVRRGARAAVAIDHDRPLSARQTRRDDGGVGIGRHGRTRFSAPPWAVI